MTDEAGCFAMAGRCHLVHGLLTFTRWHCHSFAVWSTHWPWFWPKSKWHDSSTLSIYSASFIATPATVSRNLLNNVTSRQNRSRIYHSQPQHCWLSRPRLSCHIWKLIMQLGRLSCHIWKLIMQLGQPQPALSTRKFRWTCDQACNVSDAATWTKWRLKSWWFLYFSTVFSTVWSLC